ncbi:MAG: hypothetical protein WBZ29_09425 [Methanocella sp.]
MSKPLSSRPAGHGPGLSGVKGPDRKKILLIGIAIGLGILILIILASIAFSVLSKGTPGEATPVPSVTPEPADTPTATPEPTATPSPAPTSGLVYGDNGPFRMSAYLKGSTGESRVMFSLNPGAAYVEASKLTISILCDGRTYDKVWTIRPMDWAKPEGSTDNDTMLEYDESIVADINTANLGIPQGKPMTIMVLRNGDLMQQLAVAPT